MATTKTQGEPSRQLPPKATQLPSDNSGDGKQAVWKTHGLAVLSGLLLIGAFPSLDWGWLAWFALIPFLLTFPHRTLRSAIAHGVTLGFVYFGGLLTWLAIFAGHAIGHILGTIAWLGASAMQALVIAGFAGWAHGLTHCRSVWAWRLGVPALWAVLEWMRQLGMMGTGWGDLAYTQHAALLPLQLTKLTGVWGLSFLIVLVNVALAEIVSHFLAMRRSQTQGKAKLALNFRFPLAVGGILIAVLLYGVYAIHTENLRPDFKAAALQANIDPNVTHLNPAYVVQVMQTYQAQANAAGALGAQLVVWPEAVFPGFLRENVFLQHDVSADAIRNHEAMLIGSSDYHADSNSESNDVFLMNAQGQLAGDYAKRQLVPFGEFVPFHEQMPFLKALHLDFLDRVRGAALQPLLDAGAPVGKIGVAICYESSYGSLTREQVARGAGLLAVSTDDTWFERTAAAAQHADIATVRAAESDRYLIRCAATGISEIITPTGQVIQQAGLFQQAVVIAPVQSRHTQTLYVRWGDWFVWLCALMLLGIGVGQGRANAHARPAGMARS